MIVKCGFVRTDRSIQETIQLYRMCGMDTSEAISKAERDLRIKLPERIIAEVKK